MPETKLNLSSAEYLDPEGPPLRLIRRDPEGEFPLHRHEFSELVVVFGGRGTHLALGEKHPLAAGDVFLIGAPGPPHGFADTRRLALYNLLFDRKRLGELLPAQAHPVLAELGRLELVPGRGAPLHLDARELETTLEILRGIEREQGRAQNCSAPALVARFVLLAVELSRMRRSRGDADAPASWERRGGGRLAELLMQLAEHPERAVSRREMAEKLCVSESTLQRLFRRRTGLAPHDFLMQLRLKKAAALLLGSELAVSEIAAATGFADSNYFCRRFRRYAKLSPLEYRRRAAER